MPDYVIALQWRNLDRLCEYISCLWFRDIYNLSVYLFTYLPISLCHDLPLESKCTSHTVQWSNEEVETLICNWCHWLIYCVDIFILQIRFKNLHFKHKLREPGYPVTKVFWQPWWALQCAFSPYQGFAMRHSVQARHLLYHVAQTILVWRLSPLFWPHCGESVMFPASSIPGICC